MKSCVISLNVLLCRTTGELCVCYSQYLRTNHWRLLSARLRRNALRYCQGCARCGAKIRLVVHHRHYDTLGCERKEDLEVVCWKCHRRLHAAQRNLNSAAAFATCSYSEFCDAFGLK